MPTWGIVLVAIVIIVVLIVSFVAGIYNSLVKLDERVNEAWSVHIFFSFVIYSFHAIFTHLLDTNHQRNINVT